jgi:uncharacterized Zn-binding protein involved in type VI secretion
MGQNININGESAVHAGSEGKLTTSDTCMTPPFCIPISYTNIAESKVADQTVSSVKIQGNPACNQKSIFKISKGDSPGCCGGVSSGSTQQMTKFIEGSQNVTIGGEPAVYNGLLKTSNAENTDPKPLIQPPAGKAPANTVEAPATGEFSQQFDFASLIGTAMGETNILERLNYEITDKEGTFSVTGAVNKQGLTERINTPEKQKIIVWLGDGGWKILADCEHSIDDEADATDSAVINCVFTDFANQPIEGLDCQLTMNGKALNAKTDETGALPSLTDLKTGSQIDLLVMRERTQDYKKIATLYANPGETVYSIISHKIKFESETEKHQS